MQDTPYHSLLQICPHETKGRLKLKQICSLAISTMFQARERVIERSWRSFGKIIPEKSNQYNGKNSSCLGKQYVKAQEFNDPMNIQIRDIIYFHFSRIYLKYLVNCYHLLVVKFLSIQSFGCEGNLVSLTHINRKGNEIHTLPLHP